MTRKKSNVKALALAVTCAILAGGYSGLNPVYAETDTLYKDTGSGTVTTVKSTATPSTTEEITQITVGGVTLGDFGTSGGTGRIEAANVKISNNLTVDKNLKIGNDITISGSDGKLTVNAARINGNNTVTGILRVGEIKGLDVIDSSTLTVSGQDDLKINGTTFKDGGKVAASSLEIGSAELTAEKLVALNTVVANDGKIVGANDSEIGGITFSDGKLSVPDGTSTASVNVTELAADHALVNDANKGNESLYVGLGSVQTLAQGLDSKTAGIARDNTGTATTTIEGKLKVGSDGTVEINEGAANNPVTINSKGIKVGNNSAVVSEDGFKTSGDLYVGTKTHPTEDATDARFYVKGADGSIKAADGNFTVDDKGNVVSKGSVTANEAGFNNLAVTNGLTVGSATGDFVNMQNGNVVATGSVTATGALKGASLDVTGDISTNGSVTAKGGLNAANGNFTVDGTTGDTTVKGKLDVTGNITGADIIAAGALKGKTLGVGTNGDEFTVDADGAVKAAGGKVEIDKTGKATFGDTAGGITKIEGQKITTGSIVANDTTVESTISGVKMKNGLITADSMKITGAIDLDNLTVNNKLTVGAFSVDKNGVVAGVQSINGANVIASGTGLTIGSATVGDSNPFKSNGFTVDANGNVAAKDITAGTYNGNTIGADNKFNGVELKSGDVKATKVTADTITDGTATMTGGTVTANTITASTSASLAGVTFDASGVDFNNKEIKNIAKVTATTADLGNLHIEGANITNRVDPTGGAIGLGTTVTVNNAGELDGIKKIDGVVVAGSAMSGLTIGSGATAVTIGGNSLALSSTGFNVDDDGDVTGKSFNVNGSNYLDSTGLTTGKAVIGGVNTLDDKGIDTSKNLHVGGQATFGNSTGIHTTINGGTITSTDGTDSTIIGPNKITTKTLEADTIILNDHMQDGAGNKIEIGADGHLNVAGNNFTIDTIGQMKNEYTGHDAAGKTTKTTLKTSVDGINANYTNSVNHNNNLLNINKDGVALGVTDSSNNNLGMLSADAEKATMGYGTANSIVVNKDTIKSALGTDVTRVMTNSATDKSIVDKVGSTTVTTKSGGTTFGDGTANNTLIYGSAITSTNGAATGVLDGSNLTLTNGTNSTVMNAGGATFTGADGRSDATGVKNKTTIDGGIITTDTLNVQRIELGDKLVDSNGTSHGSNLSMDEYGNIKAAGGNFTVAGTDKPNPGALHNEVGKTSFDTTKDGASMKFDNTAATNGVTSEVAVKANEATVAAGDKASFVANTNNGGTATITGGTQTVTTTKDGTVFENSAHNTPFVAGSATYSGATNTVINGNEITTGKITTDQLVIKGNGSGDTSVDGGESGSIAFGGNGSITSNIIAGTKEATFKTDETGTFTEARDSAGTGNKTTNTVNAQGNTNEVTAGTNTSTVTQTATSIGGVITNGTVELAKAELNKDGFTVEQNGKNVKIADGDVTVTNNENSATPDQKVQLSKLGSLNNLDGELEARDKYQDNKTAVGAINAEAGIRREEVARLDNRIDDVNNRVDKVGAMAAAIASLKSIGYDPQAPSEFSIGLGQYKGETGVAMGFFHYPNKNFMINVSLSTAGGETMGGIGATWRFGHKSPQKLLEEQREAQAKKELAAAEKYQAAAKLAKEAQERAEYAAKLARQAQVSADNAKAAADATQAKHFQ